MDGKDKLPTEEEHCSTSGAVCRRHLLKCAIAGSAVFVLSLGPGEDAGAAPQWVKVGAVGQFPVGVPKRVALRSGEAAFVLRQRDGRWVAVSARCTHAGREVGWEPAKSRFVCPAHQATFRADGTNPTGPARSPLGTYPARMSGKDVQIDLSKAPGRGQGGEKKRGGKDEERDHEGGEHEGREHEEREHEGRRDRGRRDDDD